MSEDGLRRAVDVACSATGLLLLAPVLMVCALAVKISSSGPVLFKQERVGLHGRPFTILKLRTMRSERAPEARQITVGKDSRITRVGAFLRRTKLDEVPQLWNVFVGEMSLVGPRPEVPQYVALYEPEMRAAILGVRPGITDPASLLLRDESTVLAAQSEPERYYREVLLPEKLRISSGYVSSRTIGSDLRMVLKTLAAVAGLGKRRGN